MGVIYCVVNTINGKRYVGQTRQTPARRFRQHARRGNSRAMHAAIQKYGEGAFRMTILGCASEQDQLNRFERRAIVALNTRAPNGYNLSEGGEGGTHHEESKVLIVKAARVRGMSEACREANRRGGWKLTADQIKRRADAQRGVKVSPEARVNLAAAQQLPEAREAQRARTLKRFENPAERERQSVAIRKWWVDRKAAQRG